jgi:hypothetical protein
MMNISDRITTMKPYLGGAAVGAVAAIAISFSTGWVVTATNMQDQVAAAKINAFAQTCEQNAAAFWTGEGNELAALNGWRNDDRKALAERFSASLSADKNLHQAIQSRCDKLLRPA